MKKQIESPEKRAEELKLNKLCEKLDELIESDPSPDGTAPTFADQPDG